MSNLERGSHNVATLNVRYLVLILVRIRPLDRWERLNLASCCDLRFIEVHIHF